VIDDVSVVHNQKVPSTEITDKIATAESKHALGGVFENVPILSLWDRLSVEYERFDPFVLERDRARVERVYRSLGYYEAHTRVAHVTKHDNMVRVEIVVEEGERVHVERVDVLWNGEIPPAERVAAAQRIASKTMPVGAPLIERDLEDTRQALLRALTDHGYAYAAVDPHADVDVRRLRASVTYRLTSGPVCKLGPISMDGLGDLPEERLRAALGIREGEPYSRSKIDSAERALAAFGVFGSVEATPDLGSKGTTTDIPVVFHVTRASLKALKAGGGAEVGSHVDAHVVVGWEHKNLFGGLRRFSVEVTPGVEFYPLTLGTLFTPPSTGNQVLPTVRTRADLLQPGFIEPRTRGRLILSGNVYRLLNVAIEDNYVQGYVELAPKAGLERDFWDGVISVGVYAAIQYDDPFSYIHAQLPAGVSTVTFGYAETTATFDLRKGKSHKPDPVNPHSGVYFSTDAQAAWGDAQDFRIRPELRGYVPIAKHLTLALRATLGFLLPYGGALAAQGCQVQPAMSTAVCPGTYYDRYLQLLQFRGFMSGGPYSNRGYPYTGVGPQQVVAALSPTLPNAQQTQLPIATGGLGLWEASTEARIDIIEKLGAVVFVDGSDVARQLADMNLSAPHLSTGIGLRYKTPVGPFRFDVGARIPGAQVFGSSCPVYDPSLAATLIGKSGCLSQTPGYAYLDQKWGQASSILGLPLAVSLAIGEAF